MSGLLTDLYQLTMSAVYFKQGMKDTRAVFNLYFRKTPFESQGYVIACGLNSVISYLSNLSFSREDLCYLSSLKGSDDKLLFELDFLKYLENLNFSCNISAVPEGTIVFPNEPILTVEGPIIEAQLIETFLLNAINSQSLIATKAHRICRAANSKPVLEFGLRRSQELGSLNLSRAAYIGGVSDTSNVEAGKVFRVPVKGTMAHSYVMSFDSELEAFEKYMEVMGHNSVLLVDTYNTIEGIKNVIELSKKYNKVSGIRLDSGNLLDLSETARKMLDGAGLKDIKIVASNDLDEEEIKYLENNRAPIDVYGVGTKLITSYSQPALGCVYKLGMIGEKYKMKRSEEKAKSSTPGWLSIKRYYNTLYNNNYIADVVYDRICGEHSDEPEDDSQILYGIRISRKYCEGVEIMADIFKEGELVYNIPAINTIRDRVKDDFDRFKEIQLFSVSTDKNLNNVKKGLGI